MLLAQVGSPLTLQLPNVHRDQNSNPNHIHYPHVTCSRAFLQFVRTQHLCPYININYYSL